MQASAEKVWAAAQDFLRAMLNNGEIFNLWFAPLRAHSIDGDSITLEVANEFSEVWLKDNYLDLLRKVLSQATARPMEVLFLVTTPNGLSKPPTVAPEPEKVPAKDEPIVLDRNAAVKELPFNPKNTFDTFVVDIPVSRPVFTTQMEG